MAPGALSVASDNTWKAAVRKEEQVRWSHAASPLPGSRALHLRFVGGQALSIPQAPTNLVNLSAGTTIPVVDDFVPPSSPFTSTPAGPQPQKSAAISFLEEKVGGTPAFCRIGTKDLLQMHGGRVEYLKRRKKYEVVERHGRPMTSAQVLGMHGNVEAQPPQHGHKSTIQHSFYRQNGAGL